MSYKSEIFKDVLQEFECEEFKLFCIDLLEQRDELNYSIPSSTSYKYHNKTQCQSGGQILHEIMVATMMNYLLGLEYIQNKFPKPKQRDCMRIAAIMHDCCKTNGGKFTVHEHPILGGKFVEEYEVEHDIDIRLKKYINRLIQSHSGQWTSSSKSSIELPKPESDDQFYIHLCDYYSSRANLDMIYSDEIKNLVFNNLPEVEIPDINEYKLGFGKYKDWTVPALKEVDIDYLRWIKNSSDMGKKEPLKTFLADI